MIGASLSVRFTTDLPWGKDAVVVSGVRLRWSATKSVVFRG